MNKQTNKKKKKRVQLAHISPKGFFVRPNNLAEAKAEMRGRERKEKNRRVHPFILQENGFKKKFRNGQVMTTLAVSVAFWLLS